MGTIIALFILIVVLYFTLKIFVMVSPLILFFSILYFIYYRNNKEASNKYNMAKLGIILSLFAVLLIPIFANDGIDSTLLEIDEPESIIDNDIGSKTATDLQELQRRESERRGKRNRRYQQRKKYQND